MEGLVHANFAIGVWRALYVVAACMEEDDARNAVFGIFLVG